MNRIPFSINLWIGIIATGILLNGCAYFNTMYNAQKKFEEAEREVEAAPSVPEAGSTRPQGVAQPRPVPIEKYRKVIETSAKLLENYPKSRWVDDALLLMGISYYRINDLPRAERKFSELATLFPNSPHVSTALIWKARVLSEQKRPEEAIALLREGTGQMKSGRRKAEALFLLGNLYYDMKKWGDAADQFHLSLQQKQYRDKRYAVLYQYGLALYHSGKYAEARDILSLSAKAGNNLEQAYHAHIYWSRSELALHNSDQAEAILLQVKSSERFLDYADDVELELANLALETGRVDDAMALYQNYIVQHETGEGRSLAFYRLANIHRYQRVNLALAKSLLDSVIRGGTTREIADSARIATDQISKGLLALENIKQLIQRIETLKSDSIQRPSPNESDQHPSPIPIEQDIVTKNEESVLDTMAAVVRNDSTGLIHIPIPTDSSKKLSPAAFAADSVLKSLKARKVVQADSIIDDAGKSVEDSPHQKASDASKSGRPSENRASFEWQLQQAYLLIAEFYEYNMANHDSAQYYYRLAAASPINQSVYWKSNLFLAQNAVENDSVLSDEATQRYRIVAAADSVPVEAANLARKALGLPLLDIPLSPQHLALRMAETARTSDNVSADSLLMLYTDVIRMDSLTRDGRSALFAKAHIYENVLHQIDSARVLYQVLLNHYQDSSFSTWLEEKLSPPDSNSIFLRSDKELFSKREAVETLLQPSKTEAGWPPPEESLRGRRYR